jgi:hypothetical protein
MLALAVGLAAVSRAPWARARPPALGSGLGYPSITAFAGRPAYLVTSMALLVVALVLACAVIRRPVEYGSALVLSLFALAFAIGVAIERAKWADAVLNRELEVSGPGYRAQGALEYGAVAALVIAAILVMLSIGGLLLERGRPHTATD